MYVGAGAAPLLVAASAWNRIAVELSTAAASFGSVITRLTTEQWMGPASLSMAAAAQPLVAWLNYTAESSELAAAQAMASAAAFETAFAMTVAPAEVAANRARLAALVATDVFGQNLSAIAATEARYGEMWAQDATAMYGYAASSAAAGRLNPLTVPSHSTNPAGIASQAAAVGPAAAAGSAPQVLLSALVSNGPNAVLGLASPAASTGAAAEANTLIHSLDGLLGTPFIHNALGHSLGGTVADHGWTSATCNLSGGTEDTVTAAAPSAATAAASAPGVTPAGVGTTPILAAVGNAPSVGRLSVPASWPISAPAPTSATALAGTGWDVPEEDEPIEAMPGTPAIVAPAKGPGAGPRYGVKPTVMPTRGLF
jgi:PPE-repeat protein